MALFNSKNRLRAELAECEVSVMEDNMALTLEQWVALPHETKNDIEVELYDLYFDAEKGMANHSFFQVLMVRRFRRRMFDVFCRLHDYQCSDAVKYPTSIIETSTGSAVPM